MQRRFGVMASAEKPKNYTPSVELQERARDLLEIIKEDPGLRILLSVSRNMNSQGEAKEYAANHAHAVNHKIITDFAQSVATQTASGDLLDVIQMINEVAQGHALHDEEEHAENEALRLLTSRYRNAPTVAQMCLRTASDWCANISREANEAADRVVYGDNEKASPTQHNKAVDILDRTAGALFLMSNFVAALEAELKARNKPGTTIHL